MCLCYIFCKFLVLNSGFGGGLDEVIKEAGDGEGADAADFGGDGSEVGAVADVVGDVAF